MTKMLLFALENNAEEPKHPKVTNKQGLCDQDDKKNKRNKKKHSDSSYRKFLNTRTKKSSLFIFIF